jgi:phosphate/sulfate permease
MPTLDAPPPSRIERILAAIIGSTIGLSVLAFVAIIVGTWQGMGREEFAEGIWPAITISPLIGLPIGFVLIIALLIVSTTRRRQSGGHVASE